MVVYAKSCTSNNENVVQSSNNTHAQITQAVIEKNNHGNFQVKVLKQILWIDGERYELQEIFGLVNSAEPEVASENDPDTGKECVICLSEPKNTTVLPCRHMVRPQLTFILTTNFSYSIEMINFLCNDDILLPFMLEISDVAISSSACAVSVLKH